MIKLLCGEAENELKGIDAQSVDSIVCDPPYALEFMGKEWDKVLPAKKIWEECLRVAKPGAILLAFGGTRTYHRLTCDIEDAGWEIRDCIMWVYGSGFPKSTNISKNIDKMKGTERKIIGTTKGKGGENLNRLSRPDGNDKEESIGMGAYGQGAKQVTIDIPVTEPATDKAKQWDGWGTALKPSFEPIIWATKPLTMVPIDNKLVTDIQNIIGSLLCPLLLNVNNVEMISKLSQNVSGGVSVSALMIAAVNRSALSADGYEKMATFNSQETVSMCLSIASLWSNILDVLLKQESRFTTSTAIEMITALKTLKSCLSESIPSTIIEVVSCPVGELYSAYTAKRTLNDQSERLLLTQEHIAVVLASLQRELKSVPIVELDIMHVAQSVNTVLKDVTTSLEKNLLPNIRPDWEPILVAMKPLDGTYAQNALKHGVAGLNIDGSRISTTENLDGGAYTKKGNRVDLPGIDRSNKAAGMMASGKTVDGEFVQPLGRFPANVIHDGSDEVVKLFPNSHGQQGDVRGTEQSHTGDENANTYGEYERIPFAKRNDSGTASRFFYCVKASRSERNAGLDESFEKSIGHNRFDKCATCGGYILQNQDRPSACKCESPARRDNAIKGNFHPTVKPLKLMEYLCTLTKTPTGGIVLDPFMGSGTTGIACKNIGRSFIGIEKDEFYFEIAQRRIHSAITQVNLFDK